MQFQLGFRCFTKFEDARDYIQEKGAPLVVKADGLAAGKGVTVAMSNEEAIAAAKNALIGSEVPKRSIVVEEYLQGEEVSVFALVMEITC